MRGEKNSPSILGGALLISGTTIGGAVLALPTVIGSAGWLPSLAAFLFCAAIMWIASLYFLEVNLWMKNPQTNILEMAGATLGLFGKVLAWTAYLSLLYCLNAAYLSGLFSLCDQVIPLSSLGSRIGINLFFLASLSLLLGSGKGVIDSLNRLLMVGLFLSFFSLLTGLLPFISWPRYRTANWSLFLPSLPIVIVSFGFQIIIPSLVPYLDRQLVTIKRSLLIGLSLPLLLYLAWQAAILGVIPLQGPHSLQMIRLEEQPVTYILEQITGRQWIHYVASLFSFFTIATSLLGVSLSLFDFLSNALSLSKSNFSFLTLFTLTLLPPFLCVNFSPKIFITALEYGSIFVSLLLIFMPAAMTLSGRYVQKREAKYRVWGGIFLPFLMIGFSLFLIYSKLK